MPANSCLPPGVGETPLIDVDGIYAKLECINPCGSVKDRIAAYILGEAKRRGLLKPGQPIVEATSGNTGIAMAYYAREFGHPITIIMPEHMTEERKAIIRELGATLRLCSKEGSFTEAAAIRDQIARDTGAYNPDQFSNELNTECHRVTTGAEIVRQLPPNVEGPIAFVAGVGTGGTLVGAGRALRQAFPEVCLVAVEPAEAAVMTGGPNGSHGIFGIGDGFIPSLASDGRQGLHSSIDAVEVVTTMEAMETAQWLSDTFRFCIGISSGANFIVAKRLKELFPTVITIFADGHQKYHSAGLVPPEQERCPYHEGCSGSVLAGLMRHVNSHKPDEATS